MEEGLAQLLATLYCLGGAWVFVTRMVHYLQVQGAWGLTMIPLASLEAMFWPITLF